MEGELLLRIGAACSFTAALMHVAIIFGGPEWYRFFGAGERLAQEAEAGKIAPTIITSTIAIVLAVWGLCALAGAGTIPSLPLLKLSLSVITGAYLLRGLLFAPVVWNSGLYSKAFIITSSGICLAIGLIHLAGLLSLWSTF